MFSGSHANADWDAAIGQFAIDGDKDAMPAAYLAGTPEPDRASVYGTDTRPG